LLAEGNRTLLVALAGIAATAAVGLAGTAASWLSARDDRANERQLAREQRFYEHRVAAYTEAIDTLEGHMKALGNLPWSRLGPRGFKWDDVRIDDEVDRTRIRSHVAAFGSDKAVAALHRVNALDQKAFAWVLGDSRRYWPSQTGYNAWRSHTDQAIENLRDGLDEFEIRLNSELTS
jgi:hypothetical protein